jgi:hypothetical protein
VPDPPFVTALAADGLDATAFAVQVLEDHGGAAHLDTVVEAARLATMRRARDGRPFPEDDLRRAFVHVLSANPAIFYKTVSCRFEKKKVDKLSPPLFFTDSTQLRAGEGETWML